MAEINVDLNDPRTALIADAISNKTCKKILELLSEKEFSEGDLAKELKIPMNTVGYNIKKLIDSGLIEKTSSFFWSVRGKKIPMYKISNKKIVIMPKRIQKGIIPALVVSVVGALGIKLFYGVGFSSAPREILDSNLGNLAEKSASYGALPMAADGAIQSASGIFAVQPWTWFLMGAWVALVVLVFWSFFRKN